MVLVGAIRHRLASALQEVAYPRKLAHLIASPETAAVWRSGTALQRGLTGEIYMQDALPESQYHGCWCKSCGQFYLALTLPAWLCCSRDNNVVFSLRRWRCLFPLTILMTAGLTRHRTDGVKEVFFSFW